MIKNILDISFLSHCSTRDEISLTIIEYDLNYTHKHHGNNVGEKVKVKKKCRESKSNVVLEFPCNVIEPCGIQALQ